MNKNQIATKIKETEEQLASLRKQLEQPEFPTLAEAKPGDKLENGCIVVHKFSEVRLALIAAPESTERFCEWSKEFSDVFDCLVERGFDKSQWFIPTVGQLNLAYKNCSEHFSAPLYWSSDEASSTSSCLVSFNNGSQDTASKTFTLCVRAFSLVSY
jgi:hypothetical protein